MRLLSANVGLRMSLHAQHEAALQATTARLLQMEAERDAQREAAAEAARLAAAGRVAAREVAAREAAAW
eukprot:scaffold61555_cov68-Phaeocystis_antarctica.AAC.1